jgi:hypothetical protein
LLEDRDEPTLRERDFVIDRDEAVPEIDANLAGPGVAQRGLDVLDAGRTGHTFDVQDGLHGGSFTLTTRP